MIHAASHVRTGMAYYFILICNYSYDSRVLPAASQWIIWWIHGLCLDPRPPLHYEIMILIIRLVSVHRYDVLSCPSFLSSLFVLSLLNISILHTHNQSVPAAHICALRLNEIKWRWDMANQIGATHVLEDENVQMAQGLKAVICFWFKENHFFCWLFFRSFRMSYHKQDT